MNNIVLPEAPGARKSRIFGVLAIVFAITIVGIPIAFVLAIIALVQSGKAKRTALSQPASYSKPANSGTVLGVIGIVLSVVMLLPALLVAPLIFVSTMQYRVQADAQNTLDDLKAKQTENNKQIAILRAQQIEELSKTIKDLEIKLGSAKSPSEQKLIQSKIKETQQQLDSVQNETQ